MLLMELVPVGLVEEGAEVADAVCQKQFPPKGTDKNAQRGQEFCQQHCHAERRAHTAEIR
jgi:hypothetical protein